MYTVRDSWVPPNPPRKNTLIPVSFNVSLNTASMYEVDPDPLLDIHCPLDPAGQVALTEMQQPLAVIGSDV